MKSDNFLRECIGMLDQCPCLVIKNGTQKCDFVFQVGSFGVKEQWDRIDELLAKICPELRNEWLFENYHSRQARKAAETFIKNVQEGEIVYCISLFKDVLLIELPNDVLGDCKYRLLKEKENRTYEKGAEHFRTIAKGKIYGNIEISKKKLETYYTLAREWGFRANIKEKEGSYLLEFYGDSQEEVDKFIEMYRSKTFFLY